MKGTEGPLHKLRGINIVFEMPWDVYKLIEKRVQAYKEK